MPHDFKKFPELTNSQMQLYYFESPHKQIFSNFSATVVKVTDGDTIRVKWRERDFDFPVRFMNIAAPELGEKGGVESQKWLEDLVYKREVEIGINPDVRVDKWGRLLGYVSIHGIDVGNEAVRAGKAKPWNDRGSGVVPDFEKVLESY